MRVNKSLTPHANKNKHTQTKTNTRKQKQILSPPLLRGGWGDQNSKSKIKRGNKCLLQQLKD
ncbi:hypothetical protein CAL7716_014650 [Calothrix sp. PCC 7716]|nr:hypothetical protein CAL7716_014650 [Calothrix sp. PCC 7716]